MALLPFSAFNQCISGNCSNGTGAYQFSSSRYIGEFKNNRAHGKGTQTFDGGDKYEGEYLNGYYHGKGTYYYQNGNKYVGNYANGKMNGQGTYTTKEGDKYVGSFVMGQFQGYGEYRFANGTIYKGMWVKSAMHGKGVIYYNNGNQYDGTFAKGKKKGKGVFKFKSGDIFVGKFANDQRHGAGVHTFFDGEKYEGKWKFDEGGKVFDELWEIKHNGKCKADNEKDGRRPSQFNYNLDSLTKVINDKINSNYKFSEPLLSNAFRTGDFETADKEYTTLYENHPKELSILLYRGLIRELMGRHRRAAADFQTILNKTGNINEILYLQGEAYFHGSKDTAGAAAMEKIILTDSSKYNVYVYLGDFYTTKKRNQKLAEKYYKKALQLMPYELQAKENLLECYLQFGDTTKVNNITSELVRDCAGDIFTTLRIANIHKNTKNYSSALKYYNSILNTPNLSKIIPADKIEKAYASRAWVQYKMKMFNEAKLDYETALKTDTLNESNWNTLAYIYVLEKNATKALEIVEKSIIANPKYDWSYTTKAEAYMLLGDDFYVYKNLEIAMKNGLDDFSYFEEDEDQLYGKYKKEKKFIELVNKYKALLEEEREK